MKQHILFSLLLLLFGCSNPELSDPEVKIISPQSMSSVSEIIEIKFTVKSNDNVEMHELLVDGSTMGEIVVGEPYTLKWNTTSYDNETIHILMVRSKMTDGSFFYSPPINLRIDHTGFYPHAVTLQPIQPELDAYLLRWTRTTEPDFDRYELFEASSENMEDAGLLAQIFDAQDTSYLVSDAQMDGSLFYHVSVVDTSGLQTNSNVMDNFLRFETIIEGGAANWGGDMIRMGEKFYILTNAYYNSHAEYEMYIISKYGQLISQPVYPQSGVGYPATLISTQDGNLMLVGTTSPAGQSDFRVLLVNSDGLLLWENNYNSWCAETPYSLTQAADGSFLITGTTRTCDVISYRMLTINIDPSGNRLSTMVGGENNPEVARGIIATNDGGWVVMAQESNLPDEIWIAKMDSVGDPVWTRQHRYTNRGYANDFIATSDGGYMVVGSQSGYNLQSTGAHLLKLNANGQLEWTSSVGECVNCAALDVKQTDDEGYILCGYKDGNDAWLVRTDMNGELLWEQVYRGNQKEAFVSVELAEDSGYYLHGYSAPFFTGHQFTWFVKTDPLGKTVSNSFPSN